MIKMKRIFEFLFLGIYSIIMTKEDHDAKKDSIVMLLSYIIGTFIISILAISVGFLKVSKEFLPQSVLPILLFLFIVWFIVWYFIKKKCFFDYLINENMYVKHSKSYYRKCILLFLFFHLVLIELSFMFCAYRLHGHVF